MRIEFAAEGFFKLPMKSVELLELPNTGRAYFLYRGEIVAVARLA